MKRVLEGAQQESSSKPDADAARLETVLYVEDDDQNWEVACAHLGKNYNLVRAKTDVEACFYIRHHHEEISAVLMDIELQGSILDGLELTRLLTRKSSRADLPTFAQGLPPVTFPIIILTAFGELHSRNTSVAAGASKVFDKPVRFGELNLALTLSHLQRLGSKDHKG